MSKPRVMKDYDKLSESVREQIKLVYPRGFAHHLVSFNTKDGEEKMGLPFETDDIYYLVRMNRVKAISIIEDDEDFDEDGVLRDDVREEYEDKHEDVDYLEENANDDNDF